VISQSRSFSFFGFWCFHGRSDALEARDSKSYSVVHEFWSCHYLNLSGAFESRYDHATRLTAQEAMEHPFFTEVDDSDDEGCYRGAT